MFCCILTPTIHVWADQTLRKVDPWWWIWDSGHMSRLSQIQFQQVTFLLSAMFGHSLGPHSTKRNNISFITGSQGYFWNQEIFVFVICWPTLVLPEPVGPTNISPCLTTVVSNSWIHLLMNPGERKNKCTIHWGNIRKSDRIPT